MKALGKATIIFDALSSVLRCDILRYIKKMKLINFGAIRKEFDLNNNNTLHHHLSKLQNAGIIQQTKNRGPYEVNKLGASILDFLQRMENLLSDFEE